MGRVPFKLGALPFCACSVSKFPDVLCAKLQRPDVFVNGDVRNVLTPKKKNVKFDAGTTAIL